MAPIATQLSLLGMLQKFLGIALKEGLPEKFFQAVIDDPEVRKDFIDWAKRRLEPPRTWREEDGVIYFTVTSNGITGEAWITHLEAKGFQLSKWAKDVLRSPDFKPTSGVTYNVAVLKGSLFTDADRVTRTIRQDANRRGFTTPHAEVACLIREQFSDADIKTMDLLWLVTMHEPINDTVGGPALLGAGRRSDVSWLSADGGRPESRWVRGCGFAFVVPQE